MVVDQSVFDYLRDDDQCIFETTPLESIARDGGLFAYKHDGFWQCMDTQRDKVRLNDLWSQGNAPWKLWA